MSSEERKRIASTIRGNGVKAITGLVTAISIWLFGVHVFIPLAESFSKETALVVSSIILISFTVSLVLTFPSFLTLINSISNLLSEKYSEKIKLEKQDAVTLYKSVIYMFFLVLLYVLYNPFLVGIHFAVSGLVLVFISIIILVLASRAILLLIKTLI